MKMKPNHKRAILLFIAGIITGFWFDVAYYHPPIIMRVLIIVFPGIIVGRFIETQFPSIYRSEAERIRGRNLRIFIRWAYWYGFTYWAVCVSSNSFIKKCNENITDIPASILLLMFGAYRLARLGVQPMTGFFYGCLGVLMILPRFEGIFFLGLWFRPKDPLLIIYQWIAFTLLLGAISAGIVMSVARRNDPQSPVDARQEVIEELMMGARICCFLAGAWLGGGWVSHLFNDLAWKTGLIK